jgi:hypothetical protein
MNGRAAKYLILSGLLGLVAIAFPALLHAQAPPGPITPAPSSDDSQPNAQPKQQPHQQFQPPATRASLNGSWKLNSNQSDDGRQKMQEARSSQSNGNGGNGGGNGGGGRSGGGVGFPGGGGGVGFPGSGGGGGGVYGRHGAGNGSDSESADDRAHMQELIDPPVVILVAQKDNEFDLADATDNKRVFFTDDRKLKKSKDLSYVEIAAHWEDNRLVSDEKTSRGNRISRTFEPQPGGKKLVETVRIESNRNQSAVDIRYVYDLIPQNKS